MRKTITISLTDSMKKDVDELKKEGRFSSVSELFRRTIESYKKERLVNELDHLKLQGERVASVNRRGSGIGWLSPSQRKEIYDFDNDPIPK